MFLWRDQVEDKGAKDMYVNSGIILLRGPLKKKGRHNKTCREYMCVVMLCLSRGIIMIIRV